jgi:hypothetical protein
MATDLLNAAPDGGDRHSRIDCYDLIDDIHLVG